MKSFQQFVEQAAAAAPAPTPTTSAPVQNTQKVQKKVQKSDPSAGVDKDKYGRWQGQTVDVGGVTEPERTEVTPGRKGPDPNLPAGTANPNRKKKDYEIAANYPTTNTPLDKVGGFKGVPKGKGWYPMDKDGNLYNPQTGLPVKASAGKGTQVAMQGGNPYQIRWPRDYFPGKKAPPGPGARPSGKPIGPARPPIA